MSFYSRVVVPSSTHTHSLARIAFRHFFLVELFMYFPLLACDDILNISVNTNKYALRIQETSPLLIRATLHWKDTSDDDVPECWFMLISSATEIKAAKSARPYHDVFFFCNLFQQTFVSYNCRSSKAKCKANARYLFRWNCFPHWFRVSNSSLNRRCTDDPVGLLGQCSTDHRVDKKSP